jgi:hypothetical protein
MFAADHYRSMTLFIPKPGRTLNKASNYFLKLQQDVDIEKYKLEKYKELFMLGSFRAMYDADLAYNEIYLKCSQNAQTKASLLICLEREEKLPGSHPEYFNIITYRLNVIKAVAEIRTHLLSGDLDHLYM